MVQHLRSRRAQGVCSAFARAARPAAPLAQRGLHAVLVTVPHAHYGLVKADGYRFAPSSAPQWHAGDNVGMGKDYTLFSTIDGIVVYQKKADRSKVCASVCLGRGVYPHAAVGSD